MPPLGPDSMGPDKVTVVPGRDGPTLMRSWWMRIPGASNPEQINAYVPTHGSIFSTSKTSLFVLFVLCHVVFVLYLCCVTLPIRICFVIPALSSFSSDPNPAQIRRKSDNPSTNLLHIRHKSDTHLSNPTLSNPTNSTQILQKIGKSDTRPTQI